jgi:hypothetical protein
MPRPILRPTQPPIQWVTGALTPGVKRQEGEHHHLPFSSAEVKKCGAIPPLSHMPSWHNAYLIKHRDNFTHPLRLITTELEVMTVCDGDNENVFCDVTQSSVVDSC